MITEAQKDAQVAVDAFKWVFGEGKDTGSGDVIANTLISIYGAGKIDLSVIGNLDETRMPILLGLIDMKLRHKNPHDLVKDGDLLMEMVMKLYH